MLILEPADADSFAALPHGDPLAVIISSTSIGYGTPQIPSLANSIAGRFKRRVTVFAPYVPGQRPPLDLADTGFSDPNLNLVYQKTSDFFTAESARERCATLSRYLAQARPDCVVLTDGSLLPALSQAAYRPRLVMAYLLELSSDQGAMIHGYTPPSIWKEHLGLVDLFIFPEPNRAVLELGRMGLSSSGVTVECLHNSRAFPWNPRPLPPSGREVSFFYGGGIRKRQSCGAWFLEPAVQSFPINLYGWLLEFEDRRGVARALNQHPHKLRYHGVLPADAAYYSALARHAWSLILWDTVSENAIYAAPNKMYDALACGVPFISGPNFLAADIAGRYNCGLIMPDFTLPAFVQTLNTARGLFGTEKYALMSEGCRRAMTRECGWEIQFDTRLMPYFNKLKH